MRIFFPYPNAKVAHQIRRLHKEAALEETFANGNVAKTFDQTVGEGDFTLPIADITATVSLRCRQIDLIVLWSVGKDPFMIQYCTETLGLAAKLLSKT